MKFPVSRVLYSFRVCIFKKQPPKKKETTQLGGGFKHLLFKFI